MTLTNRGRCHRLRARSFSRPGTGLFFNKLFRQNSTLHVFNSWDKTVVHAFTRARTHACVWSRICTISGPVWWGWVEGFEVRNLEGDPDLASFSRSVGGCGRPSGGAGGLAAPRGWGPALHSGPWRLEAGLAGVGGLGGDRPVVVGGGRMPCCEPGPGPRDAFIRGRWRKGEWRVEWAPNQGGDVR